MKKVTRNEVSFAEVFRFAGEKFGIDWNSCNDLFFLTLLGNDQHANDFYRDELKSDLDPDADWQPYEEGTDMRKAAEILLAFMEEKNVDEMRVINDI